MKKSDLIRDVAKRAGLATLEAKGAVDAVIEGIMETLESGEKITLKGFGTFYVTPLAERQGWNPQTGETMVIAAGNVAKFKAGTELRKKLNS